MWLIIVILTGFRAILLKYENITNSDLYVMLLASFCQNREEWMDARNTVDFM